MLGKTSEISSIKITCLKLTRNTKKLYIKNQSVNRKHLFEASYRSHQMYISSALSLFSFHFCSLRSYAIFVAVRTILSETCTSDKTASS